MSKVKMAVQAAQASTALESAPQITVIIPTRNESDNVIPLLNRLDGALSNLSIETVFVDDSTDDTAAVITSVMSRYRFPVRLIARTRAQRNGLSGAVVDGFAAAEGGWICVMDADLQHPPETIVRMWEQAQKSKADIVVGSRHGDLFGPFGLSRLRSFNSKLLTIIARTLFPRRLKNVSDPLTGLFLVRRTAVDVENLRPEGFKILLEILVRNPALQVSEIHFEFAPRHSGESKADVREGGRFFRHLVTLRTTANPHLGRFLIVSLVAFLGNTALMGVLFYRGQVPPMLASFLTAEAIWLGLFMALDVWVFSERGSNGRRRRFWGYFFLTQIAILLVHNPFFYILTTFLHVNVLAANLLAFIVVGLVRYLLSEQWVWTRSAMAWQAPSYFYNLHDLVFIESQVQFRELDHFSADLSSAEVDMQIRVDRQGTPTNLSGGISYDDQLGRFGFGISVLPGDYTQVVVSPLLEHSPDFLYTNVVEPILRWRLVPQGYALVKAACIAKENRAILISLEQDLGYAVSQLGERYEFSFLADDLVLLNEQGEVFSYPKPVTVDRSMINESASWPSFGERIALAGQRILYTSYARRFGLWLSKQDLPAATINTYLQRFVPQPKYHLQSLFPKTTIVVSAQIVSLFCVNDARSEMAVNESFVVSCLQQSETIAGFQPHPLLAETLRIWGGQDLLAKEAEIIRQALQDVPVHLLSTDHAQWWLDIETVIVDNDANVNMATKRETDKLA